jgi:hypothetical protein
VHAILRFIKQEKVTSAIIGILVLSAIGVVATSLSRPEPPSYALTPQAVAVDETNTRKRMTIDASAELEWRFVSLRSGRLLDRPGPLEWDLAFRRFHIATNGGPGFAGAGAAGVDTMTQTSVDTTKSGFGKWYNYGFSSHLLTPKPVEYRVLAADASEYRLRILSYYCPGAKPGCITIEYHPSN